MSLPEQLQQSDRLDPLVWKITSVAVIGSFLSQLDATVVNVTVSGRRTTCRAEEVLQLPLKSVLHARPAEGLKILSGTKSERHAIVDRL
jgi:hypothetical protein